MIYATAQTLNSAYLWAGILVGLVSLTGGISGLVALIRWWKGQAVRDNKLDALIDPQTGVMARLDQQDRQMRPNGLDTDNPGDMAKRTENALGTLTAKIGEIDEKLDTQSSKLDQHIGSELEARRQMQRKIDRKQDKP